MISLISWAIFGLIVGSIAKALMPGEENLSLLQTIGLGVVGSYLVGAGGYMMGANAVQPAGFVLSIVGACGAIWGYRWLKQEGIV